jgi:hypothetical protein
LSWTWTHINGIIAAKIDTKGPIPVRWRKQCEAVPDTTLCFQCEPALLRKIRNFCLSCGQYRSAGTT